MSEHLVVFTEREAGPVCGLDEELIRKNGGSVRYGRAENEQERIRIASGAEVVVVGGGRLSREFMSALSDLKGIARLGIGVDNIDLEAATDLGIVVGNIPEFCTEEVAEHAIGLMIAVARKMTLADRKSRTGGWVPSMDATLLPMRRLSGQTFGLVGLGKIGRCTAAKAQGLGLKTIAYDPYANPESARAAGITMVGLDELLAQSDVVSLHVPDTPETRGMINARTLGLMKPGAILVNVARGPIVDEAALAAALASGRLYGAGLDVLQKEPIQLPHPLAEFDNVIFTCHYASLSEEAYATMTRVTTEQAVQIIRGEYPTNLVNVAVKGTPQLRLRKSGV
jgi:D-3-phosphoglycerate dehydrogenase / 2-oxoglutarate reductase